MSENPVIHDVSKLMSNFFSIQGDVARLENLLEVAKKSLDQANTELIDQMEASGLSQLKDSSGRTIYIKAPSVYASISKENKDKALEYIKTEWGAGEFIQDTIQAQTLSRIIKEKLEEGTPIPSDLFTYYIKKKLGYRS